MYTDSHCHITEDRLYERIDEVLKNMHEVSNCMIMCTNETEFKRALALKETHPHFKIAFGWFPQDAKDITEKHIQILQKAIDSNQIDCLGEIGLDYYWDKENHDLQKEWFIRQLDLARKKEKPVIIHSREATADTMEIMKEYASGLRGVIHCYSYSAEMAKEYVKMGYYIGIGGVVTFKNAKKLKQVVQEIPLESIVLETDCPYLAPVPYRGKRNSSLYIHYVAEKLAAVKGISVEEIENATYENAKKCFGIK